MSWLLPPVCITQALGANVIKLESPIKGDQIRHRGDTDSKLFQLAISTSCLTRPAGKESIGIDLDNSKNLKYLTAAEFKSMF